MYSSFNTLDEKKRIQTNAQHDMRGTLINQHTQHMEQRIMNQGSALMHQRMSQDQSRLNPQSIPHLSMSHMEPALPRFVKREEPREQLKQASHMEHERSLHMNQFLEKQRMERDAHRINDQVDVIKKIYGKYNTHEYDPTPREHYREQDLGPAVNQLIDLLNSFKLSSTVLSSVANITSSNDLSLYALLASPAFTGSPLTTTPSYSDNSTRIPTTQWVNYIVTDKLSSYVTTSALTAADYVTNTSLQTNYVSKSLLSLYAYATNSSVQATYAPLLNPSFSGTVTGINKSMVGLANVDNTSDANKPVSSATQTALNLKANLSNPTFTGSVSGITSSMVGLANVDNTSDANKPVSSATQTALNLKANLASPAFTGTVSGITSSMVGLANVDNTSDANKPVSSSTQTALNLKANLANPTFTGTVSGITSSMVGLANVDNTSDVNKPVSSATLTALNLKANLANPTFTGNVSLPSTVNITGNLNSGTGTLLAINGSGNLITSSSSVNQTIEMLTAQPIPYYLSFVASSSNGAFLPLVNSDITCDPYDGTIRTNNITAINKLTTSFMTIMNVPIGTQSYLLGVDSTGNVIQGSAGGVSSFSGGTTGLTPNTATSGIITLSGTLAVANGGTGVTSSTGTGSVVRSADPVLTGAPVAPTATAGTNTTQLATTAFVQSAVNLKANLANPTFTGTVTLPAVAFTATPASGTAAFTLGIDANNAIIRTTGGSGGSVNQTTTSANSNYSIPMSTSASSGAFTPLIDSNNLLTYNPSTGTLRTPICSIPKSTTTHPNLDQYELTVGDNAATTNKSAKIIIRGQSGSDSFGPSLDFSAWSSHSTPQGRIEVLDDGNWGGTLSFFTKANAGGSAGALYKNMYLNTNTAGVTQMVFPSTPNIITNGAGYNWFIGGTQVGSFDYPSSNWRISTNSAQKLILGSGYQNVLQVGNGGLGHYPVEIYGFKTTYGSYWQYTSGGSNWGVGTTNFNIGLYVQYTVSADGGYLLASDERIKTNIKDASTGALDVIKTIPIKSHGYIDSFLNGCPTMYNVIAQDIQRTYPEAITVTESYIPDMFVKCNWISVTDNQIKINIPKPHTVIVGDKVRCILEDSSQKDITVTQVINTTTFVVEKWDDFDMKKSDEMFLYGKQVKDFLRVDKIKLGILGLAGTKELQQIVETQQQTISTMASQIGTLTSIVNQLLKKYPL
jgi:hypothetical protein